MLTLRLVLPGNLYKIVDKSIRFWIVKYVNFNQDDLHLFSDHISVFAVCGWYEIEGINKELFKIGLLLQVEICPAAFELLLKSNETEKHGLYVISLGEDGDCVDEQVGAGFEGCEDGISYCYFVDVIAFHTGKQSGQCVYFRKVKLGWLVEEVRNLRGGNFGLHDQ